MRIHIQEFMRSMGKSLDSYICEKYLEICFVVSVSIVGIIAEIILVGLCVQ